jgi:hypothetical protein
MINANGNGQSGSKDCITGSGANTIDFSVSGQKGKKSSDTFGINIQYAPVPPQPNSRPNSDPQPLKGGDIRVN